MSPRRTRSSARHAASQADTPAPPSSGAASTNTSPAAPQAASRAAANPRTTPAKSSSKKRKTRNEESQSSPQPQPELEQPASSTRRPKRQKVQEPAAAELPSQPAATRTSARKRKGKAPVTMSGLDEYVFYEQLQVKRANFATALPRPHCRTKLLPPQPLHLLAESPVVTKGDRSKLKVSQISTRHVADRY